MISAIEGSVPVGRLAHAPRWGIASRAADAVSAASSRTSINAADLKIPGIGEGIKFQNDEYLPSFPDPSALFPDPAPLDDAAAEQAAFAPAWQPLAAQPYPAEDEEDEDEEDEDEDERVGESEAEPKEDTGELSDDEQRAVAELQARDREVRAHEQAHISAGGAYIRGGASYEYERGPDDKRYAVGGEVSIDSSPVRDNPEATIAKMQVVRAAALAPADPSAQDRAVASAAAREEASAAAELRDRRNAEAQETSSSSQSRVMADAISAYTRTPEHAGGINFAA